MGQRQDRYLAAVVVQVCTLRGDHLQWLGGLRQGLKRRTYRAGTLKVLTAASSCSKYSPGLRAQRYFYQSIGKL